MKKIVVLILALGLCVVASVLIAFDLNRNPGIDNHSIPLPAVPDKMMVYKIQGLHSSDEAAIDLAKKFGIAGPITHDDCDCYRYIKNSDSSLSIIVPKKLGLGVHFNNETALNFSEPIDAPENLPSEEQAIVISDKFLREKSLYPEGDTMRSITYETRNGTGRDGTEISRREMIFVHYNRTLNGLAVEGDGQAITLGIIGQPGFVAFYYSQWGGYEPYQEFPLKRPEDALEEQRQKGNRTHIPFSEIDRVHLEYFPHSPSCGLLEPAYIFESKNITGWFDKVSAPRYPSDPCESLAAASAKPVAEVAPQQPLVSATVSPVSAAAGTHVVISGISEGSADKVQIWVFANNSVNLSVIPVSADGMYSMIYTTADQPPGTYYVVVQNPGTDNEFTVTASGISGTVIDSKTGTALFNFTGPDSPQSNIAKAVALMTAIKQPGSDDVYAKTQFVIIPSG